MKKIKKKEIDRFQRSKRIRVSIDNRLTAARKNLT